jgi:hypothetical protein
MNKDLRIKISIDKKTGELKVVQGELDGVNSSAKRAGSSTNSFGESLAGLAKGVVGLYAINKAFDMTKNILHTTMEIESMSMALESAVGSSSLAQKELKFLRKTSDELGISFQASVSGFSQFAAAAKHTS